jgi:hypothetical protein
VGEIGEDKNGTRYWKNDNEMFGQAYALPSRAEMNAELVGAFLAYSPIKEDN